MFVEHLTVCKIAHWCIHNRVFEALAFLPFMIMFVEHLTVCKIAHWCIHNRVFEALAFLPGACL